MRTVVAGGGRLVGPAGAAGREVGRLTGPASPSPEPPRSRLALMAFSIGHGPPPQASLPDSNDMAVELSHHVVYVN